MSVRLVVAMMGVTMTVSSCALPSVHAEGPVDASSDTNGPSTSFWKFPGMKTLGGRQLWADVHFFREWSIQQSVIDGHYRLLDGQDVRYESGTIEECLNRLEQIKQDQELPPMSGKAVILIHGIIRSSKSFAGMEEKLREDGYHVFGFDYPSTRVEIPVAAESLYQVIESLDGIEEINLVVHSMGGLVTRAYLKEHRDPRIKRLVMLGVPNNGARIASLLKTNPLYKTLYGPAGQQLVDDQNDLISTLPTPDFEFAVVAGARGVEQGFNPLVPGDDDGTVSLESARLPGAVDSMTVKTMHSFLMNHPEVIEATRRFLKTGCLHMSGECKPVPKEDGSQAAGETAKTQ